MKVWQERLLGRVSRFRVDTGLFFLLFYLYVWLVVDPRLIHHSLGVLTSYFGFCFSSEWPFLQERLARPGGLVEYGAGFLSQLYRVAWVGALIVTAAAWSTCLFMDLLAGLAGQARGMVVRYAPAAVLLVLHGNYSHPLSTILSLLAGLSCFALYVRLAPEATAKRLLVLAGTCVAVYHAAGAGGLLFPALAAAYELLIKRRAVVGGAALACGLGVPWLVGKTLFGLSVERAYGQYLLTDPGIATKERPYLLALFALFPGVLAGAALCRKVFPPWGLRAMARRSLLRKSPRVRGILRFLGREDFKWTLWMAMVLGGAGACAWFSLDADDRVLLEIDYYSQNEDWDQVLETATRMPRGRYNFRSNRNIILALQHTGRLGDEMFHYPQIPLTALLNVPDRAEDHGAWFQASRFFLYLGEVNHAEKCAYDALAVTGDVPAVLEHLATISVVKDQPETARLLLNALSKNPFYRGRAREMLRRLAEDPRLEADPRVRSLRSMMPGKDTFAPTIQIEDCLLALLDKNRENRVAFDLLMAHYLAVGRPDVVVANIRRLSDFGYGKMPRHYQEAVLAVLGPAASDVRVAPYRIEPEVIREADLLTEIVRRSPSKEAAAEEAVDAGLGKTYFFYLTFGFSGF